MPTSRCTICRHPERPAIDAALRSGTSYQRDTRHTFATLMLELGESPKTVQTMLGHSRVAITLDIYSHVSLELEKKAVAKLNAALTGKP